MINLNSDQSYKIKKTFNNNVVLASTKDKEVILVGKGVGFAKKQGDIIKSDEVMIEKEFIPAIQKQKEYQQLVDSVDKEVIGLTEEIITMLTNQLGQKLDQHIHIALTDHIAFALQRLEQGLEINNPFLREIKTLYKQEYKLAGQAAKMIKERFNMSIPDDEVGFITLHIHGARNNRKATEAAKYTSLIKEMVDTIEDKIGVELSYDSLNYTRLVTHLKFGLERIEKNEVNSNPLLVSIKNDFKDAYKIANKLAGVIEQNTPLKVPEDEIGYLAIHIERLKKNLN